MATRGLLLCFDAFGTLFRVKQPIEKQYGDIARNQFGLSGFSDDQLLAAFRTAFKAESQAHPNYGRASNMGATTWWTNVIHATFKPLLMSTTPAAIADVPPGLASRLLTRFASSEGYIMAPRLPELLHMLQQQKLQSYDRVVVGVITNSDDRVPGILASFGLRVRPLRYGALDQQDGEPRDAPFDIDFHCMSYDVGFEKPDPRIFRAAEEELLPAVLARRGHPLGSNPPPTWDKLYVGDEAHKDVEGARAAGWFPVLLAENSTPPSMPRLENTPPQALSRLFRKHNVVSAGSIAGLVDWLVKRHASSETVGG